MYLAVDTERTSHVLENKAAKAAEIIEMAFQSDLPITRDDDLALCRAYHALREVVQSNDTGRLS